MGFGGFARVALVRRVAVSPSGFGVLAVVLEYCWGGGRGEVASALSVVVMVGF